MSAHRTDVLIELNKLRNDVERANRHYRVKRANERNLVSRNKREGWYVTHAKIADLDSNGLVRIRKIAFHCKDKSIARRYRHQTGAQFIPFLSQR